ncbi:MAG: hypothetical protein EOP51_24495, partial [Sphingobacteriales bacterium]
TTTTSTIGNFSTSYSFTPPGIYQTGDLFRAKFSNGGCQASFSPTATYTLLPPPSMTQPADQAFCKGATAGVAFTGTNATSFTWTNSNTAIGLPASGTGNLSFIANNTTSSPITGTIVVTPVNSSGSTNCPGPTQTFTITINPLPTISVAPQAVCSGTPTTLTASGANTYTWSPAAGLSATTGTTVIATLTSSQTYTVTGTDANGCVNSATVTVSINPIPVAPTANGTTICGAGTAVLTASGCSGGTLKWYDAATGGNQIGTGGSFTTPSISATTSYWVSCTSSSNCEGPRTQVTATVNTIPSAPTGVNGARCGNGTVSLTASGCTGGTLNWYANPTGGSPLGTGTNFTTPNLGATTTYYVSCTVAGCEGPRTAVTATINPVPGSLTAVDGTSCGPGTVTLDAIGCTGTLTWYNASTGGTSIGTGSPFTTPAISNTMPFFVSCVSAAGCEGPRTQVMATIRPVNAGSISADQTICNGGDPVVFTSVDATSSDNQVTITYQWQSSTDGGNTWSNIANATSTTYNIPAGLTAITQYRRVATGSKTTGPASGRFTCSVNSNTVTVTINPLPTLTLAGGTFCKTGAATLGITNVLNGPISGAFTAVPAGLIFTNTNSGTIDLAASTAGTYTITYTFSNANNCTNTGTATIIINPLPAATSTKSNVLCNSGTTGSISVSTNNGTPPYSYVIAGPVVNTSGASSGIFTGLSIGSYTITITDSKGCVTTTSQSITQPPVITATTAITNVLCNGASTGAVVITPTGGTGPYTI